ncbi:xanthine dehydrogenase accessory factor [Sphingomonas vulcanisoli]|uniref:Xanthine dehydrogenase accessory factor n=1 Tax=Sphingomonas vulcanisoli TaxID=1658060 RepID=A0ABX0TN64_9SPHN|nr:XdhC family protein [Sphingomonas vulcanisoli]NIJ06973.1 xanthine dehydrogenase accessory factor [Sphingomonas vulcanisoli]
MPDAEIDRLIAAARGWAGAPMAIATVTATWGSAPRPRGSHMLVHADGRFEGSVSGGCVEGQVLAAAAETIADGRPRRLQFGVADDRAWEVGLPCGGEIAILVQPVGEGGFAPALFDAIGEARGGGRALEVATDLDSGVSSLAEARADLFLNRYAPPRRVLIIGAVQIAQALAQIAAQIDARPIVIDPRGRFLTEERFPGVELDDRWPDEAVAAYAPNAATAIITLSHDPKIDDPALIAALASPAGYIAALGSTRSHAKRLERLTAAGVDAAQFARIDAPAGLPIGALGPAEIALSIAAGMVRAFRG